MTPADRPGIIYLAVCRVNQKAYVGKTIGTLRNRAMEHMREGKQVFCRAIRKYGIDNFDFGVLESAPASQLSAREQFWIERLGSRLPVGYNRSGGGEGVPYQTGNARKKMSEARKEVWRRPEYRSDLAKKHWTKSDRADEIRAELSARAKKQHEDGVLGGYRGGGVKTARSKAKISAAHKALWASPGYREMQSKNRTGRTSPRKGKPTGKPAWNKGLKMAPLTPEQRQKSIDSMRLLWQDPEFRARRIAEMRRNRTPESYVKAGLAIKAALARKKAQKT